MSNLNASYQTPESLSNLPDQGCSSSLNKSALSTSVPYIDSFHLIRRENHSPEPRGQFIPIKENLRILIIPIDLTRREMASPCQWSMLLSIRPISLKIRYRFRKFIIWRLWMRLRFMWLNSSYNTSAKSVLLAMDSNIPHERFPMKLIRGLWTCDARTIAVTRIVTNELEWHSTKNR